MKAQILLPLLSVVCSASASAQRVVTFQFDPYEVRFFDVAAGAVLESFTIDMATVQPPLNGTWKGGALSVANETWVAAGDRVYRFDTASGAQVGAIGPISPTPLSLTHFGGSVWLAASTLLIEFALDGTQLNAYPTNTPIRSVFGWNGRLFAATSGWIDEYDASGQFLGTFSPSLTLTNAQMADSPATGNLLVTGATTIYELDASGALAAEHEVAVFEQGVQELPDGRLLVSALQEVVVFDRATGHEVTIEDRRLGVMAFGGPSLGATERHCQASPNSTGAPARLDAIGSVSLAQEDLSLDASSLPPDAFGLFFYGADIAQLPWGDGFLCTGPILHRIDPAVLSTAGGFATRAIVYADLPPAGTIVAGSTWSFQLVYRDPGFGAAEFNTTDAVRLTFEP